jgi:hypothetical protein
LRGRTTDEAFGRSRIGGGKDDCPVSAACNGEAHVHPMRRVQLEARMPVLSVIPAEEVRAVGACVF